MKRMIAILVAVSMMILVLPMFSFAEETIIPELRITSSITSIEAGKLPAIDVSTTTPHVSLTEDNWWGYLEKSSTWKNADEVSNIAVADGSTQYAMSIRVNVDTGYTLDETNTKVYYNDTLLSNPFQGTFIWEWGTYIHVDFGTIVPVIKTINITDAHVVPIGNVVVGDHMEATFEGDLNFSILDEDWYCQETYDYPSHSSVFEEGKTYRRYWILEADEGCVFAENPTVLINGSTNDLDMDESYRSSNRKRYYIYTKYKVSKPTETISSIDIQNADIMPRLGEKASDYLNFSIAEDAPYTAVEHFWYCESTGSNLTEDSIFEKEREYCVCFAVAAKEGYKFDEKTDILINGSSLDVDPGYTLLFDESCLFWTYPIAAVLYGDANGDSFVDMKDVLAIRKHIVPDGIPVDEIAADADGDRDVDMADVLALRKFLVGTYTVLGPGAH